MSVKETSKLPAKPITHYGILYIQYAKYLSINPDMPEPLCISSKEQAQLWMDANTVVGFRLKNKVSLTKEEREILELSSSDEEIHNHLDNEYILNDEDLPILQFQKAMKALENKFDTIPCLRISDKIMSPTFGHSIYDGEQKSEHPEYSTCCDLYEKSHFEIVEIAHKTKKFGVKNGEETGKLINELIKYVKRLQEDDDVCFNETLLEKFKKQLDISIT